MPVPNDSKPKFQRNNIFIQTHCFNFQFLFHLLSPEEAPSFRKPFFPLTMATSTLKWPLRIGPPKSTSDNSMFSDNDGSNPNANDTPTFFTIKNYKWLLQYQQLFQFYLVHGHTNVTRRNADNSLAEWASYQRSKMVATDKYDVKWKHLLNGIGFCSSPLPPPTRCSRSTCLRTMFSVEHRIQSLPRKPTARTSMGGGNTGDNKENIFCWGSQEKSKTTTCRKYLIYILQAYLVAFHLKCKMAFHLECINCRSHGECLPSTHC
jgi:hypothetical protein